MKIIIKTKHAQAGTSANNNTIHTKLGFSLLRALITGMVLCSVSVVTHAAESSYKDKPVFTLKVVDVNPSPAATSVTVPISKPVSAAQDHSASHSIRLKDGGVIWVSKDPSSLTPMLNVSASQTVEMTAGQFAAAMSFKISTNYAHFIDRWELEVYRADDEQQKHPLARFTGRKLDNGHTVEWDGISKNGERLKAGDKLSYILKVRDKAGHLDKTHARELSLIGPERNLSLTTNSNVSGNLESNLALQTIPVHGSRVRIFGRDIPTGHSISIDDKSVALVKNKFVIEKLLPEGSHRFDIAITDSARHTYHKPLQVDLNNKYLFMVGLADVTIGKGRVTDNLESLSDGDKYLDGDIFVDGRLAFYLKGKIKGKYLVTAQMDTGTDEIENLFDNIHKKDPQSLFRRLDPDKYYPVYGDDSTIVDDTNSQGKLYVRVDWDKSRAIWGNYNTDMTGTELSAFNRSLYGVKFNHRSTQTTTEGEHKTDVTVFASEAQSAFRHNEFLGTGGSLYYLKDADIVNGSEKVWIEVRQGNGERVVEKIVLQEGRDYQIDDFQGRIILHRPLLQIVGQSYPALIKDAPIDGNHVYLMVDYEYVPDDFDSNKASYGSRGKVWVNDHVAIGGTYAHEDRNDNDYALKGVDITLRKNKGTYLKAEYAESESKQTQGSFASDDGGLNFTPFASNSESSAIKGSAFSVEARADFEDFSTLNGSIGAWFKERVSLATRTTQTEKRDLSKQTTASVQGDVKVNDKITLSGELRHIKDEDLSNTASSTDGVGTLAAIKMGYDINQQVNLYGIVQHTLKKEAAYENNDLATLGIKGTVNSKLDANAEVSSGDRGDGLTLGADYKFSNGYSLYTNTTISTDSTNRKKRAFTVGQRKTISNQLRVYTEHQYTHEVVQSWFGHTFGLDYQFNKVWTTNASVQSARLDKAETGLTDRDAISVGLNYKKDATDASTRLEYRNDKGSAENSEQWVTTNKLDYQFNPSLRLQGKLNYSETKDLHNKSGDAKFTEAAVGFALRPIRHDRLNMLGRLTYLYDLPPQAQTDNIGTDTGKTDEKSLISSLEATYQLNQHWQIGGKLAHKTGEVRSHRNTGNWSRDDASLAATRVRYHLTHNWDAMAEYHWLKADEAKDTQHGAMISFDRHIGKNLKLGIGYNFTRFDDDLRSHDVDAEGWFINLVGKY